jgi:mRNA interferase MazF
LSQPLRGQVFEVEVSGAGRKPFLIVSNKERNRALDTVLVIRITTAPRPNLATIVAIPAGESVVGRALCDYVTVLGKDRLGRELGALSARTMRAVDAGLKTALALVP